MTVLKVAYQAIDNRPLSLPSLDLVNRWSTLKVDIPDDADSTEEVCLATQTQERSPTIEGVGLMTGMQLHSLIEEQDYKNIGIEVVDNIDLDTALIVRPILLVAGDQQRVTGDIRSSIRHIRRMNLESSYPVIWVNMPVICVESDVPKTPIFDDQVKASQSQTHITRLTKGDISRIEAETLGISPAALRKRKSRERLKSQAYEKK